MLEWRSSLPWLQPVLDVGRLLVFAAFVGLGVAAARSGQRRSVDRLLAFVLVVSSAVGLTQVEAWPFTNWALVHHLAPRRFVSWQLEGIDQDGRTWPVDARVLQPMAPEEFGAWMLGRVRALTPEGRQRLGAFLLRRAEAGRRALRAGQDVGVNERLLGAWAAPFHFQQKRVWRSPADVPPAPFAALQLTLLQWDVEERALDESRVTRSVVLRHPEP